MLAAAASGDTLAGGVPVSLMLLWLGALDDVLVPQPQVQSAADRLGGRAALKWLARAGHDFPLERPDEVVSMILSYVRQLPGGAE